MKRRFTILTAAFALLAILAAPMGTWGQAPVGTTLWGETWTGGEANETPSAYGFEGTTVYGGATLTYAQSSTNTYLYAETLAGGTSPELLLSKSNQTWTISNIPTGQAAEMSLTFLSNKTTFAVTSSTSGIAISGSQKSWTISVSGSVTSFDLTIKNTGSSNARIDNVLLKVTTAGGTGPTLEDNDLALTGAPIALEFDLYDNSDAQVIHYTTSSTGAVTVSASDYISAVVDETAKTITVTPVSVTPSIQTITVSQAADATYAAGSTPFTVYIEDNTPFDGVIFDATKDKDENNTSQGAGSITKDNVTFSCTSGILGNGTEYRMYKNSTTTISITGGNKISKIEFIGVSEYAASNFTNQTGWTTSGNNGIWEGEAESVSFLASGAQVRATLIKVTVLEITTPSISANDVNIAYDAISGEIAYTLNNPASNGNLSVSENVDWISDAVLSATQSKVTFTTTANEATTVREGIITITYTYGDNEIVSKDVAITQAAAPVIYTTIPELFAAATATETEVFVTFNNWVVSGVSTNGKNVYVTDNSGNGFIIYFTSNMSETFSAGKILNGTAVSCKLKLYNGAAELVNLNASDLSITDGGTVSIVNIAMANLSGVNTGALVHYDNLTCSMDNNKYYLSDGTTTVQAYNTLYAFNEFEAGKTYNVTGVYVQYNTVKEIAPRSADDIEEVVVPVEEYTLTIDDPEHIAFIVNYGEEVLANGETAIVESGTEITLTANVDEGYILEGITVTGEEGQTVIVTEDPNSAGVYSFTMPAYNVTVSATATEYIEPTAGNYVRITSLDQLTDGSKVIIAARHNTTINSYYAMKNSTSGKPEGTQFTSAIDGDNEVISSTISDEEDSYYWTITITDGYFTFTNANDQIIGYSSSTNFATEGDNTTWTIERSTAGNSAMVPGYEGFVIKNGNIDTRAFAFNGSAFGPYAWSNNNAAGYNFYLDFFVQSEDTPTPETYTLTINGYEAGSDGGYYLITTPVTVDPATVAGMTEGEFDLYQFNQSADKEWENWDVHHFNLVPGKGYLYAKQATTSNEVFQFELTGTPYDGTPIYLSKTGNGPFVGWNLVGNPFNQNLYLDQDFYIMGDDGDEIIASNSAEVTPMQGFFVIADEDGEELHFIAPLDPIKLVINVSKDRGNVIDRAIVRFGEGRQLPKFQLNPNNTKIYVTEGNQDFAVVRSANEGEMPVSFKAAENGTYTINVDVENMEMDYLHLIDNMTGADVDLLQTPSYSFEASTRDYASRFRLLFSASDNDASTDSENFAFFNGSEWQISNTGDAQLHVVDMTGRIVSTETISGNATVQTDAAPGVYMLRLINGDNVKVQKIIIK